MDIWENGFMVERLNGCLVGKKEGWMDGWKDGWDGWVDGWMDEWDGWVDGDGWKDESVDTEMSDQRVCRVGKVMNAGGV